MANFSGIKVEVVFATSERQWLKEIAVTKGSSAMDAVSLSGLNKQYAAVLGDDAELNMGVFGKSVPPDYLLAEGDRVELYRPLKADCKDVRRELARQGKVMGQAKASGD